MKAEFFIKIELDGKVIELTDKEARQLYEILRQKYQKGEGWDWNKYIGDGPAKQPIPYYPTTIPDTPWWREPVITWSSNGGIGL